MLQILQNMSENTYIQLYQRVKNVFIIKLIDSGIYFLA